MLCLLSSNAKAIYGAKTVFLLEAMKERAIVESKEVPDNPKSIVTNRLDDLPFVKSNIPFDVSVPGAASPSEAFNKKFGFFTCAKSVA
jgi:hypothetical protein